MRTWGEILGKGWEIQGKNRGNDWKIKTKWWGRMGKHGTRTPAMKVSSLGKAWNYIHSGSSSKPRLNTGKSQFKPMKFGHWQSPYSPSFQWQDWWSNIWILSTMPDSVTNLHHIFTWTWKEWPPMTFDVHFATCCGPNFTFQVKFKPWSPQNWGF